MRVVAVKGTNACSPSSSRLRISNIFLARITIERPSGVSSASDANWATSATSRSLWPATGKKLAAMRLPSVMVPVLSSSSTCTSPAASTARPLIASTFRWTRRSIPAMPIAESSAPMVVGIRQTSRATRTTTETVVPAKFANGTRVITTGMKTMVKTASRIVRAISFGVF